MRQGALGVAIAGGKGGASRRQWHPSTARMHVQEKYASCGAAAVAGRQRRVRRTPCDDQKFDLSRMVSKSLPKPVDVDLGTFLAGTRPGPLRPGTIALAAAGTASTSDASMARRLVSWSEPMAMAGVAATRLCARTAVPGATKAEHEDESARASPTTYAGETRFGQSLHRVGRGRGAYLEPHHYNCWGVLGICSADNGGAAVLEGHMR